MNITAPVTNAIVQGTTSIVTTASDNVGVAGVQFRVDGQILGSEDTSSPYIVAWDTSKISNGIHQLTAVARDIVGISPPQAPYPSMSVTSVQPQV